MKKKSPDILWVFAAIFAAGILFSAVSEGGETSVVSAERAEMVVSL